jgi:hypothetical protein
MEQFEPPETCLEALVLRSMIAATEHETSEAAASLASCIEESERMHFGSLEDYRERAENELRLAQAAQDETLRRAHFLQAAVYFNHTFGGDPRPGGDTGRLY